LSGTRLIKIALGAVLFAAAVLVAAALLTVLTVSRAAPVPAPVISAAPGPTYSLCTPTSGGVLPADAVREPLPRGGADELIRQADHLVLSGQTAAAGELYRQRLDKVPTDACAARGLAYLAALSGQPGPAAGAVALGRDWDSFYAAVVAPVWHLLLPGLAVLVILLLAARIATRFVVGPGLATPDRGSETGLTARRAIYGTGLAFLGGAAVGSVVLPGAGMAGAGRWFGWLQLVALALAGVVLTALGRGLGLRVQIEGRDAEGKTTAMGSHVLARLQQLGSERPRGIGVPQQTDVSSLPEDALTALPQGDVAKAVFRAIRLVAPVAPWRVTITKIDGGAVVEIVRNGRLADSEVIQFTVPPPKDADGQTPPVRPGSDFGLVTAAAAFILATLARRHPALQLGLAGATRWRSIYLQVRGLSGMTETARQKPMLVQAVEADPGNVAARLALLHFDGRRASTAPSLKAYAVGLDDLLRYSWPEYGEFGWQAARPPAGWTALHVRMLFNLATAWINHYLARLESGEEPDEAKNSWSRAWDAVRLLTVVVQLPHRGSDVEDLVKDLTPATTYLRAGIVAAADEGWTDPEPYPNVAPLSLTTVYTRACLHAIIARQNPAALSLALDDLEAASAMPGNREWAREDPAFSIFRRATTEAGTRARYAKIVGVTVPTMFMELPPLADHAAELKGYGIRSHEDLLAADQGQLATALSVSPLVVTRWRRLAELARTRADGKVLGVDVLFLLVTSDIDSVDSLGIARSTGLTELVDGLGKLAVRYGVRAPTAEEITAWQVSQG
jgi:hypothetical protein